jgi:hypothetical protein
MNNEFAPFGDARQRILGEASTSRDLIFATYQAIADSETNPGRWSHVRASHKCATREAGPDVHRGTVRTLLYAGGFVQRDGRWFAAPQSEIGARKLRAALVETLVAVEGGGDDGGKY